MEFRVISPGHPTQSPPVRIYIYYTRALDKICIFALKAIKAGVPKTRRPIYKVRPFFGVASKAVTGKIPLIIICVFRLNKYKYIYLIYLSV